MANIKFNNTGEESGCYTLTYNPRELEINDGGDYDLFDTLDDAPVIQRHVQDARVCKMIWYGGIRVSNSDWASQVATLRGYVGLIKYINFSSAWYGDVSLASTWQKHRIIDLVTTARPGGTLKYDRIELLFVKEP